MANNVLNLRTRARLFVIVRLILIYEILVQSVLYSLTDSR